MFGRFNVATIALALTLPVAFANPTPAALEVRTGGSQCNTGSIQCCNSVQEATSSPLYSLLGLLGLIVGPVTGQVGVDCSPISAIGVGGNSCSAQPVCCTGNNFNGLIVGGCSPININL